MRAEDDIGKDDRVAVLEHGVKIVEGSPKEIVRDRPVETSYLGARVPAPQPRNRNTTPLDVVLHADSLQAGYGDLAAVRDLSLTVHAGEVVALLGPNASGKTTVLLTLVGELPPISGELQFLGRTGRQPLYRRVRAGLGFVPDDRSVFQSLSVAANLRLGPGPADVALGLFPELRPLLRRRAGLCSGGEQQILSLARALAARPRLLVVDELSLGLAPPVVDRLLSVVRRAADENGTGVILVEQQLGRALQVSDRACVLDGGRVVLEGSSNELLADKGAVERAYSMSRRG